jgi:hypothetical protein
MLPENTLLAYIPPEKRFHAITLLAMMPHAMMALVVIPVAKGAVATVVEIRIS